MTPVISPEELQSTRGEMAARDRNRFLRAALVSGLFHATLIALLIGLWQPAAVEPPPVIPVTLAGEEGIAGAAGAGNGTHAPESHGNIAVAASPSSSSSAVSSTKTPPSATKPAPAQTAPNAAADTAPPPTPTQMASAEPTPRPQPTQTPEPVPPRKPPRAQRPLRMAQVRHPSPTPAAPATAPPRPLAPPVATPSTPAATASTAANGGSQSAGGSGRAAAGAGRSDTGNGAPEGPGDDYLELVRDWIARFQRYPDDAITKREEGVVSVGFKFARDGAVLDVWIDKSSGYPLLDKAAIKMIRDASPLPKPPPRYKGDTLTLVIPERFRIGLFDRIFH